MRRALLPLLVASLAVVVALGALVSRRDGTDAGASSDSTRPAAGGLPVNGGRGAAARVAPGTAAGAAGHGDAAGPTATDPAVADDAGNELIDRNGDLGAADRAWLAELWDAHHLERPAEPWVVHWALVRAGEPLVDDEDVAATAARILADPRGWDLGGAIRFERVASADEADFRLVVAAAEEVPGYSESCVSWRTGEADASCTVGNDVIINDHRWRDGALGDPIPLEQFRVHELNHEIGHWLGQGHFSCLGGTAAVNQQQFRSLAGCRANEWPLPFEQAMVAARYGLWPELGAFEPYDAAGAADAEGAEEAGTGPAADAEAAPQPEPEPAPAPSLDATAGPDAQTAVEAVSTAVSEPNG